MIPQGHLKPQGVSRIVSSDTVEAIEGYTAVLSELLFDNNKLAKFKAYDVHHLHTIRLLQHQS